MYVAQAFLEGDGLAFSSHAAVISVSGQYCARTGRVPVALHRLSASDMAALQDIVTEIKQRIARFQHGFDEYA